MNYDVFKAFVDEIQYPAWIIDVELTVLYINNSYKNFFRENDEDVVGMSCSKILSESKYNIIKNKCNTIAKNKDIVFVDDYFEEKEIKIKLIPIINCENKVSAISGIYIFDKQNLNKFIVNYYRKNLKVLKNKYRNLEKLTYIDIMTDVYNRNYYEKICEEIVTKNNIPLGLIMADADGLKLINDTFGHSEGDKLLINIARILRSVCSSKDYVFRIGGDEFIILTLNSNEYRCKKLISNISDKCKEYEDEFFNISISLGFSIIDNNNFDIRKALREAEDKVYRQKLIHKNSLSTSVLNLLMRRLRKNGYETEEHSSRVVEYSIEIGKRIPLSISSMPELILVAKLHDIGKVGIDEKILLKPTNLTYEEFEIVRKHTEKGYRILKALNHIDSVAKGVLTHHERWDGKGYPLRLKGESIPLVARIVAVADSYDIMTTGTLYKKPLTKKEAIDELKLNAGYQFDPQVVRVFVNYLQNSRDVLKL